MDQSQSWLGRWIWHEDAPPKNATVLFRKTFRLDRATQARIYCTATNRYWLYVNGQLIGRGPAPSDPRRQSYDTYTLNNELVAGENCIAVICHNDGEAMVNLTNQNRVRGGLIIDVALRADGQDSGEASSDRLSSDRLSSGAAEAHELDDLDGYGSFLGTDSSWKTLIAPWMDVSSRQINRLRGGFAERFDARRYLVGWQQVGFDDRTWQQASELTGDLPWKQLVPRQVPQAMLTPVFPVNVYHIDNYRFPTDPEGLYPTVKYPTALIPGSNPHHDGLILDWGEGFKPITDDGGVGDAEHGKDAGVQTTIVPGKVDRDISLLLDFGRIIPGLLHVELDARPGVEIELGYGENLNVTYIDTYITRDGVQSYEPLDRRCFRYLKLTFRNVSDPVIVRQVLINQLAYPVQRKGIFETEDERINRIVSVGADTLYACMHDHYEDCPWREQSLYIADLQIEAFINYYTFGDFHLARNGLRQIAAIQEEDGWLPSAGPYPGFPRRILEFGFYWVVALDEYVMYSGDVTLARELYPAMRRVLAKYESLMDVHGLIPNQPEEYWWTFIDWGKVDKRGVVTAVQCLYVMALDSAARIAGHVNRESDQREYQRLAAQVKYAINRYLWNDNAGAYIDCLADDGPSKYTSRQTNALAVVAGVATPEKYDVLAEGVLHERLYKNVSTALMNYFVARALVHMDRVAESINLIKNYWGEMIARGATTFWEMFDPATPAGLHPSTVWSQCHGFSAGPTALFPGWIAGIRPTTPGYATFIVEPRFEAFSKVHVKVPTPNGIIQLDWTADQKAKTVELSLKHPDATTPTIEVSAYRRNGWTIHM